MLFEPSKKEKYGDPCTGRTECLKLTVPFGKEVPHSGTNPRELTKGFLDPRRCRRPGRLATLIAFSRCLARGLALERGEAGAAEVVGDVQLGLVLPARF